MNQCLFSKSHAILCVRILKIFFSKVIESLIADFLIFFDSKASLMLIHVLKQPCYNLEMHTWTGIQLLF